MQLLYLVLFTASHSSIGLGTVNNTSIILGEKTIVLLISGEKMATKSGNQNTYFSWDAKS